MSSALAKSKNLWAYAEPEADPAALAAAYAFGISADHPFLDGNKRTAYVVCRTFQKLNGSSRQVSCLDLPYRLQANLLSIQQLGQETGKSSV